MQHNFSETNGGNSSRELKCELTFSFSILRSLATSSETIASPGASATSHNRSNDDFGANLWSLHCLRLTNRFRLSAARPVFEQMNVEMAAILYRFDAEGAYRMWDTAPPSVW